MSVSRWRLVSIFVLGLMVTAYVLAGLLGIQAHVNPVEMDTTDYLKTAYQIRTTGGILNHVQNCLSGVYREGTQHPLYLLLISPFAEKNIQFFVHAKMASGVIGLFLLLVYFFSVRHLFGAAVAWISACFLITSATFINLSTMVACESLLALFFILFWLFAAKGFKNQKYWLLAGLFAGAAFLTKSIAIMTMPIFFLTVLLFSQERKRIFSSRLFWAFFAVFFLTASPLLIRNVKVYGTPFYSDSTAVMWIDRWHDFFRPDFKENPPTLFSYVRTHPPAQIGSIFLTGLFGRNPKMIADGLKPFAFWESKINLRPLQGFHEKSVSWEAPWAWFLVLLCLAGLWKSRKQPAAQIALTSMAVLLPFVGWFSKVFPGSPPTRLLYPLFFFIYIFGAVILCRWGDAVILRIKSPWTGRWPLAVAAIFTVVYLASMGAHVDWRSIDPRKSYGYTSPFVEQLFWMKGNLRQGDVLMAGTVFTNYLFYFENQLNGQVIAIPRVETIDQLVDYARGKSVRYGIMDLATVAYNLKPYRNYFDVGPSVGLRSTAELPEPFKLIFSDPRQPSIYKIYELSRAR